jgi:hypothetical protein
VNADNVRVNAKVDYTLLDRWRHSQAWRTRRQLHEDAAAASRGDGDGGAGARHDERETGSARVVHMPLAD